MRRYVSLRKGIPFRSKSVLEVDNKKPDCGLCSAAQRICIFAMICNLCPRRCGADRSTPQGLKRSICRATDDVEIALVSLHAWEEPILESGNGAGTVFFSHCNLRCCFCQNYEISAGGKGLKVTTARLTLSQIIGKVFIKNNRKFLHGIGPSSKWTFPFFCHSSQ